MSKPKYQVVFQKIDSDTIPFSIWEDNKGLLPDEIVRMLNDYQDLLEQLEETVQDWQIKKAVQIANESFEQNTEKLKREVEEDAYSVGPPIEDYQDE